MFAVVSAKSCYSCIKHPISSKVPSRKGLPSITCLYLEEIAVLPSLGETAVIVYLRLPSEFLPVVLRAQAGFPTAGKLSGKLYLVCIFPFQENSS